MTEPLIPYLLDRELRSRAERLLSDHHPDGTLPIPIEKIIEIGLGLDIIPTLNLMKTRTFNGFLSGDCTSIYVDEGLMETENPRYFFTLGHELGHLVLHRNAYPDLHSFKKWHETRGRLTEGDFARAESQADAFAGLVLVPADHLKTEVPRLFSKNAALIRKAEPSFDLKSMAFWEYLAESVGQAFRVSSVCARIRLQTEKYWCRDLSREK